MRQDRTEPADTPGNRENASENGYRHVGNQSRGDGGETEGEHQRPGSRRRHADRLVGRVCWGLILHIEYLSPDDVHHDEDGDPDGIDEMPIQRKNLRAFRVFLSYEAKRAEDGDRA